MQDRQKYAQLLPGKRLYSKAVLMDTGAFLALNDQNDSYFLSASGCLHLVAKNRLPVYVSVPTIYETHRRILYDLGQSKATKFLDTIYDGSVNIVCTTPDDEQQAKIYIIKYEALKLTLTDAVNMALMVRLGFAVVFSFDNHFLQAGFIRIPPFHL